MRKIFKPGAARLGLGLAALLAAAAFAGCGGGSWRPFSAAQDAAPSPFADIPVPEELTIDDDESRVYASPDGRLGLLRASGRLRSAAVLYYYRETMAQNGWRLDSEFTSGKRHMLIFRKKTFTAAVTVIGGWIYTELEINVARSQSN